MNKQQALETLKHYNEWRRGNDCDLETPLRMPNPKDIGEAIDVAIAALSDAVTLPKTYAYAEVRKCEHCWHVGVDDRADGIACCGSCGWSGDEPKEDKCPSCEIENHMMAACPKCNEEYHLVDSIQISCSPDTANVLEQAAKVCDGLAEQDYCVDVRQAATAIRALIPHELQSDKSALSKIHAIACDPMNSNIDEDETDILTVKRVKSMAWLIRNSNSVTLPDGWVAVPVEIIDRFPEINMGNYTDDNVYELNNWGIEVVQSIQAAPTCEKEKG